MLKQYLYQVSILSKKTSHPLDSISHYSGEDQYDVINSKNYVSNTNEQVIWSNLIVPDKSNQFELFMHLPDYLKFRSQKPDIISNARNVLWKNVDSRECRPDSQFSRLFELAIPHFISQDSAINLVSCFAKVLTTEGMITDCSIHTHNKKANNMSILEAFKNFSLTQNISNNKEVDDNEKQQDYTAFIMCTLRDYQNGQFVNKNRNWNSKEKMKEWRSTWSTFLTMTINNSTNINEDEKLAWNKKLAMFVDQHEIQDNKVLRLAI